MFLIFSTCQITLIKLLVVVGLLAKSLRVICSTFLITVVMKLEFLWVLAVAVVVAAVGEEVVEIRVHLAQIG